MFVDRGYAAREIEGLGFSAKFGGATGQFNAHLAAYPNADWVAFGNRFVVRASG